MAKKKVTSKKLTKEEKVQADRKAYLSSPHTPKVGKPKAPPPPENMKRETKDQKAKRRGYK